MERWWVSVERFEVVVVATMVFNGMDLGDFGTCSRTERWAQSVMMSMRRVSSP